MRLALTADQLAFRDQLRAVLADRCRPADVRAAWSTPRGWDEARWAALAQLGVTGLTVPTDRGGLGMGEVTLAALLVELGRAAAPEPVADTVALAVPVLAALAGGGDDTAAKALERIAAGELVAGVAAPPLGDPARAADAGAGAAGAGPLRLVPASAELAVVVTPAAVHLLPTADLAVVAQRDLDGSRRPGLLPLPEGLQPAVAGDRAAALWAATVDRAAVAAAALLVGLADGMLAMASDYVRERVQFGRPVGSFQAVKHRLADVAVAVEHARPAVWAAAWSLEQGEPTVARDASTARALATDAATGAARAALQVHGAIGYTWEHDLHLWMKRVWALAPWWGDAGWHRARVLAEVAARLGGPR